MENFVGIGALSKIPGMSWTSLQMLGDSGATAAVRTAAGHRRLARAVVEAVHQQAGSKAVLHPASAPAKGGPYALTVRLVGDAGAAAALVASLLGDCCPGGPNTGRSHGWSCQA